MDLFIAHQRIPHRAGVILAQQAESVQPGAAHLVEDMLQRGGSVTVDIQFPMGQFLSLLVLGDGFKKCGMYMNIDKQRSFTSFPLIRRVTYPHVPS